MSNDSSNDFWGWVVTIAVVVIGAMWLFDAGPFEKPSYQPTIHFQLLGVAILLLLVQEIIMHKAINVLRKERIHNGGVSASINGWTLMMGPFARTVIIKLSIIITDIKI
ncbi:MAG: hypothetical protein K2M79_01720 [Muribaculaceae bacterium]|nr:hypothetical protein [Muribaculaceae bacterium]